MVFMCCVPNCKGTIGLHSFPANAEVSSRWISLTNGYNLKANVLSRSHHKVCKKHFAAKDFEPHTNETRLVKNALPSLFLPEPLELEDDKLVCNREYFCYYLFQIHFQKVIFFSIRTEPTNSKEAKIYFERTSLRFKCMHFLISQITIVITLRNFTVQFGQE